MILVITIRLINSNKLTKRLLAFIILVIFLLLSLFSLFLYNPQYFIDDLNPISINIQAIDGQKIFTYVINSNQIGLNTLQIDDILTEYIAYNVGLTQGLSISCLLAII